MTRQAGQLTLELLQPRSRGLQRSRADKQTKRNLPRLSVSPDEAADMLGVSRDYLDEHVLHELRSVRRGRRVLIALAELERWLDRAAEQR
jgi:excisionase family DNA binding protein